MDDLNNEPCPRRGKWIAGCRFVPRYDIGPAGDIPVDTLAWFDRDDRVDALKATAPKTYVRDVCVTCGRTIDRPLPFQREEA